MREDLIRLLRLDVPDTAGDTRLFGTPLREMTDEEARAAALWLANWINQMKGGPLGG